MERVIRMRPREFAEEDIRKSRALEQFYRNEARKRDRLRAVRKSIFWISIVGLITWLCLRAFPQLGSGG